MVSGVDEKAFLCTSMSLFSSLARQVLQKDNGVGFTVNPPTASGMYRSDFFKLGWVDKNASLSATTGDYQKYFAACQPASCTYQQNLSPSAAVILALVFGLLGGLVSALKTAVPVVVDLLPDSIYDRLTSWCGCCCVQPQHDDVEMTLAKTPQEDVAHGVTSSTIGTSTHCRHFSAPFCCVVLASDGPCHCQCLYAARMCFLCVSGRCKSLSSPPIRGQNVSS